VSANLCILIKILYKKVWSIPSPRMQLFLSAMSKQRYLLVCVGIIHLQTVLMLGASDFPSKHARSKSRKPLALACVLKPTSIKTGIQEDVAKVIPSESKKYKVNNRMMGAKEVEELLSSSGCDLLCPSQTYPNIFRKWYWRNYQGCVFKASALQNGMSYVIYRSERIEEELLRKKSNSESDRSKAPKKSTVDLNSAVDTISKGISYLGISSAVASGTYVLSTFLSGIAAVFAARK
jgi:hypothetical protein